MRSEAFDRPSVPVEKGHDCIPSRVGVRTDTALRFRPYGARQIPGNDNRGLRDGVYDERRDWFLQNVRLMRALTQKGYDVNYSWGVNLHGQKFGGAIMPEMMRWLWRDAPVSTDPYDMTERSLRPAAVRKK